MSLFIRHNLKKGESSSKEKPATQKQGEARGGNYVARVQVGYEKDGSPRYKYFKTIKERDEYLQNRGKSGTASKRSLKTKLKREQKTSRAQQDSSHGKVERGKPGLYVKKKGEEDEDAKKSISVSAPMFIWRLD